MAAATCCTRWAGSCWPRWGQVRTRDTWSGSRLGPAAHAGGRETRGWTGTATAWPMRGSCCCMGPTRVSATPTATGCWTGRRSIGTTWTRWTPTPMGTGIRTASEVALGMNPTNPGDGRVDTDGDGVPDTLETAAGCTSPAQADVFTKFQLARLLGFRTDPGDGGVHLHQPVSRATVNNPRPGSTGELTQAGMVPPRACRTRCAVRVGNQFVVREREPGSTYPWPVRTRAVRTRPWCGCLWTTTTASPQVYMRTG
jgi:hypothetical protein